MVWLDRGLSMLLILGGAVHTVGSIKFYDYDPLTLLWSLCASLFIFLFGAASLLRASRPGDRALAWICLASGLAWIAAALCFGFITARLVDTHVLIVIVVTLGMCIFSVRTLMLAKR